MIIYDKSYNIFGIGKNALNIIEYDSMDDFFKEHKKIEELIYQTDTRPENVNFLQDVLSLKNRTKHTRIKTKSGDIVGIIAKAQIITSLDNETMYTLELQKDEQNIDVEVPKLRLPLIRKLQKDEQKVLSRNYDLDDKWILKTQFLLNLEQKEFINYLDIFIQYANRYEISLQNAIATQDIINIKKIIDKLKKTATNLHISPLIKIYQTMQNANISELKELLSNAVECTNELRAIVEKYQE